MRRYLMAIGPLAVLALVTPTLAQTQQQSRMQQCAAEWQSMKAANQTQGKTYRAFQKECLARTAAAPAIIPPLQPGSPPAAKTKAAGGREAMLARERACGAEWRAAKTAGTVPAGMRWPKYWSECNARKKAEGM